MSVFRTIGATAVVLAVLSPIPVAAQIAHETVCDDIQAQIEALPLGGGVVAAPAGVLTCSHPIVIDRDNITLRGQGAATVLRLADGANAPVLIIGQAIPAPTVTRRNIRVSDLTIDGNRLNQTCECWHCDCPTYAVRNNGLTLRRVEDVIVERVSTHGARSGGLVTELGCRRLSVDHLTSFDNHYDGLAAYVTEDSTFSNLFLHDNGAAGLSFDLDFNHNTITDATLTSNGDVGLFAVRSADNLFHGLRVRDSGNHGIYLNVDGFGNPATRNTFDGVVVSGSAGYGVYVGDPACVDNLLVAGRLVGNSSGCVWEAVPDLLHGNGKEFNICSP